MRRSGVFFHGFRGVWIFQRLMRVSGGVVREFGIAQAKMTFHRMILRCGELAMELVRADVRRVLKAHDASVEGLVGNGDGIFPWLGRGFADGKGVFPDKILGFKTDKLHDDAGFTHSMFTAVRTTAAGMLCSGGLTEKKGEPAFADPPFVTRGW
jgi:hypothetical protein